MRWPPKRAARHGLTAGPARRRIDHGVAVMPRGHLMKECKALLLAALPAEAQRS